MDVMSSDLYEDEGNSDDSFPDIAKALGFKTNKIQRTQPSHSNRNTRNQENMAPAQNTSTRPTQFPSANAQFSLGVMQQYINQTLPQASQETLTRKAPNRPTVQNTRVTAQSRIEIDLDGISSSSPFPAFDVGKPAANRAKSFNSVEPILSSSPLPRVPPVRTPIQRASTFHSLDPIRSTPPVATGPPRANQLPLYHEISDDDDEDLRAAIAASLADLETPKAKRASAVPMKRATSAFQCPDEAFRSSPPPSQKSVRARSEAPYIPRATPLSSQIRPDTRRLLDALDDITMNMFERKADEEPTRPKKKAPVRSTAAENTENPKPKKRGLTQEQRDSRAAIQTEKQLARETKRREKEAKLAEKAEQQQIDALNRLKTRKETCPELMAYIPPTLPDALHDSILGFLEPLGMDTREWNPPTPDIIKFVRKVNAEWDVEGGFFRPCEEYRRDEEWIIHWMKADKFVELTSSDQTRLKLRFHMERLKNVIPGAKVILILEGLAAVFTRAMNAVKRNHDARARAHMGEQSRGRKDDALHDLDFNAVEDALVELQVVYEVRIVQTTSAPDSAEWISILATDISSIPHKSTRMFLDRSFCMESGQIKSGSTVEDTYHKMLQQIHRVTPPIADAIIGTYKTVHALIRAFQRGGPDILEDLQPRLTGGGSVSQRRIGPALSKRVYEIFMGRDQFALA